MARTLPTDPQNYDPALEWESEGQGTGMDYIDPRMAGDARLANQLNMYAQPGQAGPGFMRDTEQGTGMGEISDPQELIKFLLMQRMQNHP